MESGHFVITRHEPVWRRPALVSRQVDSLLVVAGYNVMPDDAFMVDLVDEYPGALVVFNSQIGIRPPGSEDREGPGWRIIVADDDSSPFDVPFDALAAAGLSLY